MFNRIRASIAGEQSPSSPEKSPGSSRQTPPPPPPERGIGFLPAFLSNAPSAGPDRDADGGRASLSSAPRQEHRPSFFGGFLPQAASPSPTASPHTIRASAAALLKLATPPLTNGHPDAQSRHAPSDGLNEAQNATLEHQVARRDQYIARLQHDLEKMQGQLTQYQKDSGTLRRQQLESTHRHSIVARLWRRTNDGLRGRVECFEGETTPAAAREIANLIRDAAPPNKDSAYLLMLQDQLTKANAKLDHLGSQTEIVLHKGEEVVESLREEMNEVIRERCRMELELLDQERMLEDDMRRMVLKTERRLKRVQGEIDFLEKNAVAVLKSQEEDEEEDEGGVREGEEGEESEEEEEEGEEDTSHRRGEATCEKKNNTSKATAKAATDGSDAEPEPTPELLRKELRKIATERDRSLSVLQKKLREKNEEFHALARAKEERETSIRNYELDKRDREEWEQSRREEFSLS